MTIAVVCLMGLPGAGKSSLVRQLHSSKILFDRLRRLTNSSSLMIEFISFDEIERGGVSRNDYQFSAPAWQQSRLIARDRISRIRSEFSDSSSIERLILLDDNFFYKSMRKQFRPNGVIFLNRAVDDCMKFNAQRDFSIPARIIESMALSMEFPEPTANCPVLTICPSLDESVEELSQIVESSEDFWIEVMRSATQPVVPSESRDLTTRELLLNDCESRLRKCVSLVASKVRLSKEGMKRISELKSEAMLNCKSMLTSDTRAEAGTEFTDSLIFKFSLDISQIR